MVCNGTRAQWKFRNQQPALRYAFGKVGVAPGVQHVDSGSEDGDRGGRTFEGAAMGRSIDTKGKSGHDGISRATERLGERVGVGLSLSGRITAADDRNRR